MCVCVSGPQCVSGALTVRTSQRHTVLSAEQVTRVLEKGRKRALLTEFVWPRSVDRLCPVLASHSLQRWSMAAEASRAPAQCQLTAQTGSWWSANVSAQQPRAKSHSFTVPSPDAVASCCPLQAGDRLLQGLWQVQTTHHGLKVASESQSS